MGLTWTQLCGFHQIMFPKWSDVGHFLNHIVTGSAGCRQERAPEQGQGQGLGVSDLIHQSLFFWGGSWKAACTMVLRGTPQESSKRTVWGRVLNIGCMKTAWAGRAFPLTLLHPEDSLNSCYKSPAKLPLWERLSLGNSTSPLSPLFVRSQ